MRAQAQTYLRVLDFDYYILQTPDPASRISGAFRGRDLSEGGRDGPMQTMKATSKIFSPWIPVVCLITRSLLLAQEVDLSSIEEQAVRRVQQYVRVDTIKPPGNESRGVEFFAEIFEAEGIRFESMESDPGRGNIWAKLEGGPEPALVLLHHIDVVPADRSYWTVDPLSGEIRDGYIYGRGTLDTKALGIMHLQTFLALHRMGARLNRDVIFMATADEEAGGFFGAGWLVQHRPELFKGVGWLLNEGGGGRATASTVQFHVEVTQKVPLWLRLRAKGVPGHGSMPRVSSSVTRLIRALARIQTHEFEPRIVPAVDAYFKGMAAHAAEKWRHDYRNMAEMVRKRERLLELQLENPVLAALTRNTCSLTVLQGSSKINVVPPEARAELDCRLLPDEDPEEFEKQLASIINDPEIRIERIMGFSPAVSTTETELFRAIESVGRRHFAKLDVIPSVSTGFTDSHFFRDIGITCYGLDPFVIPAEDSGRFHGNDERISVENVRLGTRIMFETVREVAVEP